jgi:hypothetical protein
MSLRLVSFVAPALLASMAALAGCSQTPHGDATQAAAASTEDAPPSSDAPTGDAQAQLTDAAQGMIYTSESDYPYTVVSTALGSGDAITGDLLKAKFASDATVTAAQLDTPLSAMTAEEVPWEQWFTDNGDDPEDPTTDPDVADQYAMLTNLKGVMEQNLTDLHVFRVSAGEDTGPVFVFLVGRDKSSNLLGLLTVSIET